MHTELQRASKAANKVEEKVKHAKGETGQLFVKCMEEFATAAMEADLCLHGVAFLMKYKKTTQNEALDWSVAKQVYQKGASVLRDLLEASKALKAICPGAAA